MNFHDFLANSTSCAPSSVTLWLSPDWWRPQKNLDATSRTPENSAAVSGAAGVPRPCARTGGFGLKRTLRADCQTVVALASLEARLPLEALASVRVPRRWILGPPYAAPLLVKTCPSFPSFLVCPLLLFFFSPPFDQHFARHI